MGFRSSEAFGVRLSFLALFGLASVHTWGVTPAMPKADRLAEEELQALNWTPDELRGRRKSDVAKNPDRRAGCGAKRPRLSSGSQTGCAWVPLPMWFLSCIGKTRNRKIVKNLCSDPASKQ